VVLGWEDEMREGMLRDVLQPFDFERGVSRGEAARFLGLSALVGFSLAVPGLAVGFYLSAAEQRAWSGVLEPGTRYLSWAKVFFLPAVFGMVVVFSGSFKALVALIPWLDSRQSTLAWLTRMAIGVVLGSAVGLVALWMLLLVAR